MVTNEDRPCDLSFIKVRTNGYTFRNLFTISSTEENSLPYSYLFVSNRDLKSHISVNHSSDEGLGSRDISGFRFSLFINKCFTSSSQVAKPRSDFYLFDQKYAKLVAYTVKSVIEDSNPAKTNKLIYKNEPPEQMESPEQKEPKRIKEIEYNALAIEEKLAKESIKMSSVESKDGKRFLESTSSYQKRYQE